MDTQGGKMVKYSHERTAPLLRELLMCHESHCNVILYVNVTPPIATTSSTNRIVYNFGVCLPIHFRVPICRPTLDGALRPRPRIEIIAAAI